MLSHLCRKFNRPCESKRYEDFKGCILNAPDAAPVAPGRGATTSSSGETRRKRFAHSWRFRANGFNGAMSPGWTDRLKESASVMMGAARFLRHPAVAVSTQCVHCSAVPIRGGQNCCRDAQPGKRKRAAAKA